MRLKSQTCPHLQTTEMILKANQTWVTLKKISESNLVLMKDAHNFSNQSKQAKCSGYSIQTKVMQIF